MEPTMNYLGNILRIRTHKSQAMYLYIFVNVVVPVPMAQYRT